MAPSKRKILIVLKVPPPVHGSTLMNQRLMNSELIKNSFECHFLGLTFSNNTKEIGRNYIKKLIQLSHYRHQLKEILKKNAFDLVYFALSPSGIAFLKDLVLIQLIKKVKLPIIYHLHGKGTKQFSDTSIIHKKLVEWTFKNEHVICLSRHLTYDVAPFISNQPCIVPNGIECVITNEEYQNRNYNEIPHLIFLSNFTVSKGILLFIESLSEINESGLSFTFSLIGNPFDVSTEKLKSLIDSKGLNSKLSYIGPKYDTDKWSQLLKSDILVFPTFYKKETFGLVLLEAMQAGLAVISTNIASIPDIISNNVNGFVIPVNDQKSLTEKIAHLIQNKDIRIQFGKEGRKMFLEKFQLNKFENQMVNTINEIAKIND